MAEIAPRGTGEGVEGKQLAKNDLDPLSRFDTIHICHRQDAWMRHREDLKNRDKMLHHTTHVVVSRPMTTNWPYKKNRRNRNKHHTGAWRSSAQLTKTTEH